MREDDVCILGLLCCLVECIEIAEADAEDDVASVTCELVDCLGYLLVILRNVVYDVEILIRIKTALLHSLGDTLVMRIGITCGVVLAVDVDRTNLER